MSSSLAGASMESTLVSANGADLVANPSAAADEPVRLNRALESLVNANDLAELGYRAAHLPADLLGANEVLVILRSAERDFKCSNGRASSALEAWAEGLLARGPLAEPARDDLLLAVSLGLGKEPGLRGIIAVVLGEPDSAGRRAQTLQALAGVVAGCGARLLSSREAAPGSDKIRSGMARGLHDLCTPLNSLRLGLQLLEPGISRQDPSVAKRAHRAVDRMAGLVSEMFALLEPNLTEAGPH
jgi:signal transduction histidine kinase